MKTVKTQGRKREKGMKELVIQLPDNYTDNIYTVANTTIRKALINAKPLPENHGRLIDIGKVEFVDVFPVRAYDKGWHNAVRLCVETLRNAPTVLEATKEGDGEL